MKMTVQIADRILCGGRGLRPELSDANWEEIRDLSYERGKG